MARARNIKPSFFMNERLADCVPLARLCFAGLWTIADREGRLEDRPKKIKAELLPYDDCDCTELLNQLCINAFILRYEVDGEKYIQIKNFTKHQNPHHMEVPSIIPAPDGYSDKYSHSPIGVPQRRRIYERDKHKCRLCGSRDRLHIDHVIAVSKGGTSDDDNLRTLCHACNLSKGNRDDISLKRQQQIDNEMTSSQPHLEQPAPHPTDSLNLIPLSPIPHTDSLLLREGGKSKRAIGTRLTRDWELPEDWGDWAETLGMTSQAIINEADKFKDFWIGKAGASATKTDWQATWRNWIRRHLEGLRK